MNYLSKAYKRSLKKKAKHFSLLIGLLFLFIPFHLFAQEDNSDDPNSFLNVNRELESFGFKTQDQWSSDTLQNYLPEFPDVQVPEIDETVNYIIYPYWQGRLYREYEWDKIDRFAYFGYLIDIEDGYPQLLYSWKVKNVVDEAKKHDTKVDLMLFCNSKSTTDAFLESDDARENCIEHCYSLVNDRKLGTKGFTDSLADGDGVNVYFPFFEFKKKKKFKQFIEDLHSKLNEAKPAKDLIVTFPLADTVQFKFILELAPFVDELHLADYNYLGVPLEGTAADKYIALFEKEKKSGSSGNKSNAGGSGASVQDGEVEPPTGTPDVSNKATTNSNSLLNLHRGMQAFGYRGQDQWDSDALCSLVPYYQNEVLSETNESSINYLLYPYWQGNLFNNYNWDSIQRVGYFAYLVNAEDGSPNLIYSWNDPNVIETAKDRGTEVDLVLFCGSVYETNQFLEQRISQENCIETLEELCSKRDSIYTVYCEINEIDKQIDSLYNADGVNVFFPYNDFSMKREFGLFIKDLYWDFKAKEPSRKLIVTLPYSDTTQFHYLLGIEKYIDELHFVNYDYRGYNPDEVLTKQWNVYYKSDETDLGFFEQIVAEMRLAEFFNPFDDDDENIAARLNNWELYFLAICAIVVVIFGSILLALFWCKFNQLVVDYLVIFVLLMVLLVLEIVFLFFFMVEEMNFDVWLINTNNTNSNFFLLVPIVMILLFPVIKILQNSRDLP